MYRLVILTLLINFQLFSNSMDELAAFFTTSDVLTTKMIRQVSCCLWILLNVYQSTGYVMHQQFNIQQLYALPTLYLCFVFI
jgi:hypothetical protein